MTAMSSDNSYLPAICKEEPIAIIVGIKEEFSSDIIKDSIHISGDGSVVGPNSAAGNAAATTCKKEPFAMEDSTENGNIGYPQLILIDTLKDNPQNGETSKTKKKKKKGVKITKYDKGAKNLNGGANFCNLCKTRFATNRELLQHLPLHSSHRKPDVNIGDCMFRSVDEQEVSYQRNQDKSHDPFAAVEVFPNDSQCTIDAIQNERHTNGVGIIRQKRKKTNQNGAKKQENQPKSKAKKQRNRGTIQSQINDVIEWTYVCNLCSNRFETENELLQHISSHLSNQSQSSIDNVTESTQTEVRSDDIESDDPKSDSDSNSDSTQLNEHVGSDVMKSGSDSKPYECQQCGSRYRTSQALTHHMKIHELVANGEKNSQIVFLDSDGNVVSTQSEDDGSDVPKPGLHMAYQCLRCTRVLKTAFGLRQHLQGHKKVVKRKKGRFTCVQCEEVFSWRSDLLKHYEVHFKLNGGMYECQMCSYRFKKSRWKRHLKYHFEEC